MFNPFEFKNKGALVPLYFCVSLIGTAIVAYLLKNYVGGPFQMDYDTTFVVGIGLVVAGIWTMLTSDNFYINEKGEKRQMYEDNTFYFIHMKLWAYIFLISGMACAIGGALTMLKIID